MLLPRHPLVRAPLDDLPFRERSFGGLWISGGFTHLPRESWRDTFARLMALLDRGPVYFACYQGSGDLEPYDDPTLGEIFVSEATEGEVASMMNDHGLADLTVEVRPDPILDRRRPWVVALGHRER